MKTCTKLIAKQQLLSRVKRRPSLKCPNPKALLVSTNRPLIAAFCK
jgi:hypothetical protein